VQRKNCLLVASIIVVAGNIGHNKRPFRNPASKWYLSRKEYKYDTFPMWLQGLTYFLSPRLAKEIYNLSFTTPYIFTGKLLNIKLHEEISSFF